MLIFIAVFNIINYYVCLNHPQNWLRDPTLFLGDSYTNSISYPAQGVKDFSQYGKDKKTAELALKSRLGSDSSVEFWAPLSVSISFSVSVSVSF